MAAGESAVNRASMAQAAQQVESAYGMITGLQSNMNGYSSQLGGGWQGNAAVAFTRTYEMFSADFAKVLSALQVIHDKLVSTRNTYQATEDANTARVNQVSSMINGGTALSGAGAVKGAAAVKGGASGLGGGDVKGGIDIAANQPPAAAPPAPPAPVAPAAPSDDFAGGLVSSLGGLGNPFGGATA